MAGLAALLSTATTTNTQTLDALAEALAPRGAHADADAAIVECGAARLLIRSALPKVHESCGATVIVDGIAETSSLIARYGTFGATGLVHGRHPYALILADSDFDGLVLARHLDGPPLYYARAATGAVIVASEPTALIRAGIAAAPNEDVIARFLDTGACDDAPATFFDAIRRVLPGQVVEIGRHTDGWSIRTHPPAVTAAATTPPPNAPSQSSLSPLPAQDDIDEFLRDLGEPTPCLSDYLLWAAARAAGGELDVLVSPGSGGSGHLSRLADRIESRYGVTLRFAPREREPRPAARLAEALQRIRPAIAESLLYPRYGTADFAHLTTLSAPHRASPVELERLWRFYLIQRWMRLHTPTPTSNLPPPQAKPPAEESGWQRHTIAASDTPMAEKLAWRVCEFIGAADRQTRRAFRRPWLLIVSARAVAISQGQARPIWEIKPGRLARALTGLGGERHGRTDPWTMQVALEVCGRLKLCASLLIPIRYRQSLREIHAPRESAPPPANICVIGPPRDRARAIHDIAAELRRALPDEIFATLLGCAIVGAGRVLAWSGAGPAPTELLVRLADGIDGAMLALTPSDARKTSRKPAKRR